MKVCVVRYTSRGSTAIKVFATKELALDFWGKLTCVKFLYPVAEVHTSPVATRRVKGSEALVVAK